MVPSEGVAMAGVGAVRSRMVGTIEKPSGEFWFGQGATKVCPSEGEYVILTTSSFDLPFFELWVWAPEGKTFFLAPYSL